MSVPESDRALFLALAELHRRHLGNGGVGASASDILTGYELRGFSQNGEDGVLAEILARIGTAGRRFVEFGIESGREGNCVLLADVLGWAGAFLEPDPHHFALLEAKYAGTPRVLTRNVAVTPQNVEPLFDELDVGAELDVLSIDVDGQDYWIWQALSRYRPRVVVIEYNSALPLDRHLVQPIGSAQRWDGTDYFGASLGALEALAAGKGYRLVHTDLAGCNAFFVRQDLGPGRFPVGEEVPRRSLPNYYLSGIRHPVDPQARPYLDLQAGELRALER